MTDEETEAALALQLTLPVCSAFVFFSEGLECMELLELRNYIVDCL